MTSSKNKLIQLNNQTSGVRLAVAMIAATVVVLATVGALNGGVAVTTGVWDALLTTVRGLLTSTWVLALAFIALVASVWQIAHGRGYGALATVLGLLAVALIGPGMATSMATATHERVSLVQNAAQHGAPLTAAASVR